MSSVSLNTAAHPTPRPSRILPLEMGDNLDAKEFERRYEAMPEGTKAELIDGVVYMSPPLSNDYPGDPHFGLITCLGVYVAATPDIRGSDNGTIRLDPKNEPQPDIHLRRLPSHGGLALPTRDGYLNGPPDFIAEVAASSASCDLHQKLEIYRGHGVREYFVWCVYDEAFHHFFLAPDGQYEAIAPIDGQHRSRVFPGLWLDSAALTREDLTAALVTVQNGIASPEHQAFVQHLAQHKPA